MSNYSAPTRHPVTGAIEMAEWLDDHDGKHRYGVRFPSDGKIYGGKDCVEVRAREMLDEIKRLRAVLDQLLDDMGENGLCVCQQAKDEARAALAGEKTDA